MTKRMAYLRMGTDESKVEEVGGRTSGRRLGGEDREQLQERHPQDTR